VTGPTYSQAVTLTQSGGGLNQEGVEERILSMLAILASGTNPDGTPSAPAVAPIFDNGGAIYNVKNPKYGAKGDVQRLSAGGTTVTTSTTLTNGTSSGTSLTISTPGGLQNAVSIGDTFYVVDGVGGLQGFSISANAAIGAGSVSITAATVTLTTGSGYTCWDALWTGAPMGFNVAAGSTTIYSPAFLTQLSGTYRISCWGAAQVSKNISNITYGGANSGGTGFTQITVTVAATTSLYSAFGRPQDQYGAQAGLQITIAGTLGFTTNNPTGTFTCTSIFSGTPSTTFTYNVANASAPTGAYSPTGQPTAVGPALLYATLTTNGTLAATLGTAATYAVTNSPGAFGTDDSAAINAAVIACQNAPGVNGGIVYYPPGNYGVSANQISTVYGEPIRHQGAGKDMSILTALNSNLNYILSNKSNGGVEYLGFDAGLTGCGCLAQASAYANQGSGTGTNATQTVTIGGAPTSYQLNDGTNLSGAITVAGITTTTVNTALAAAVPTAIDANCTAASSTSLTLVFNTDSDVFLTGSSFVGGTTPTATFSQTTVTLTAPATIPNGYIVNMQNAGTIVGTSNPAPFNSTVSGFVNNSTTLVLAANPPTVSISHGLHWGSGFQPVRYYSKDIKLLNHAQWAQTFAYSIDDGSQTGGNPFQNTLLLRTEDTYIDSCYSIMQEAFNVVGVHVWQAGPIFCDNLTGRGLFNVYAVDFFQTNGLTSVDVGTTNSVSVLTYDPAYGSAGYVSDGPVIVNDPNGVGVKVITANKYVQWNGFYFVSTMPVQTNVSSNGQIFKVENSRIPGGLQPQHPQHIIELANVDLGNDGVAPFDCTFTASKRNPTGTFASTNSITLAGTTTGIGIGWSVLDTTTPSSIPPGSVIQSILGNVITLNNSGVNAGMAGDTLLIAPTMNISITGGSLTLTGSMPIVHASTASSPIVNLYIDPSTEIIGTPSAILDHGTLNLSGRVSIPSPIPFTLVLPASGSATTAVMYDAWHYLNAGSVADTVVINAPNGNSPSIPIPLGATLPVFVKAGGTLTCTFTGIKPTDYVVAT
jgi:hypothetical protein